MKTSCRPCPANEWAKHGSFPNCSMCQTCFNSEDCECDSLFVSSPGCFDISWLITRCDGLKAIYRGAKVMHDSVQTTVCRSILHQNAISSFDLWRTRPVHSVDVYSCIIEKRNKNRKRVMISFESLTRFIPEKWPWASIFYSSKKQVRLVSAMPLVIFVILVKSVPLISKFRLSPVFYS